jgi:NCS1 family nucleobase:cation symporter-1
MMQKSKEIKEKLARKYRQPKGVEQFGIEVIPEDLKTVRWWDLFAIIINFLINPGMIVIAGMSVVIGGLSFWAAITAEVLGIFFAFSAYIVMATVGVDYGLPGQVATRMAYGIKGSKWLPSLIRTVASIYWFSFQTLAGAAGITAVIKVVTGASINLIVVSVLFAIFQSFIAILGYDSLKILSRIAFPVKLIIMGVILLLLITHNDPNYEWGAVLSYQGKVGWQWAFFAVWVNSMFAAWLSMITDAADFCRYSKTRVDMWIGTLSAACIGAFISAFIGAYGAAATLGKVSNVFEVIPQINTNIFVLFLVFVVIVLDNWTINVLNLYTGGLSLSNMFTSIGRFWTTIIVAVIGVILAAVPSIVNQFVSYMTVMGNFFSPIAAILMVDYIILKRTYIDVVALFDPKGSYSYSKGFNLVAVVLTFVGFGFYLIVPQILIKNLVTIIVIGVAYYISMKLTAARTEAYAVAAKPGQQYEDVVALVD